MNAWEVLLVKPVDGRDGPFKATLRSGARCLHLVRLHADELDGLAASGDARWAKTYVRPPVAPPADYATHAGLRALAAARAPGRSS